jgi:hypothetical protein
MNQATKDIMALLKIDAETAFQVQDLMMINGFDFSESSKRVFNLEAKECFQIVKLKNQ